MNLKILFDWACSYYCKTFFYLSLNKQWKEVCPKQPKETLTEGEIGEEGDIEESGEGVGDFPYGDPKGRGEKDKRGVGAGEGIGRCFGIHLFS